MLDARLWRRMLWLSVYAASMGFLEAAVVVYLRELYYPGGFHFPIVLMPGRFAAVEVLREVTTLLMLSAVAALAGRDHIDRFFVFAYLFGLWDLIYYASLWILLGWPPSLLTWDILFLIPVPWLGPVLYPVVVSTVLMAGFLAHESLRRMGRELRPSLGEWTVATAGAVLIVVAFCWNYRVVPEGTEPQEFPVALFAAGLAGAVISFARAGLRALRLRTG